MALSLVVVSAFGGYPRGAIISDPSTVASVRSGENAHSTVLVSDQIILPPVPPSAPNIDEMQEAYRDLQALYQQQTALLASVAAVNASQSEVLAAQNQRLGELTVAIQQLEAKVTNPNSGPPVLGNLADDKPLAEASGEVLQTNSGKIIVGDLRQ